MKKFLFALTSFLTLLGANPVTAEKLRVGIDPSLPPFEFIHSETGQYSGFDIDLIQAISKRLNATIVWNPMGFDALLAALRSETIDVAISDITITPERLRRVAFTRPVFNSGTTIVVRREFADKIKAFDDLKNHIVCVQNGSNGQNILEKNTNLQVVKTFSALESIEQVKTGRCDAAIGDRPIFQHYINISAENQKKLVHQMSSQIKSDPIAIAVNKKNKVLLDRLNKAIYDMIIDGEFTVISEKWFH